MTTRGWTTDQLDRISEAQEMHIAARRPDGSVRKPVIVWMVRVGDDLYTGSVNGADAAYRAKYGQYPGPVAAITSPSARATTLKLVPHAGTPEPPKE